MGTALKTWALSAGALIAVGFIPVSAQEIPVGVLNSLTGPVAFGGVPIQNGMRLAIEQANKDGLLGSGKVKIFEADTASDKGQAINVANQFIRRDKVSLVLGPTSSYDAVAVGPVVNDNKTPMMSVGSATATLATGPWAFKIQQDPSASMQVLADYALQKTQAKRIAMVFDPGNDGLISQKDAFGKAIQAGGGTILSEDAVAGSETNFLALATKLSSMNVDGIFIGLLAEPAANLVIQLRQAGLSSNVRFFGPPTVSSPQLAAIGGRAVEGFLVVADYANGIDRPLNKAFEEAYRARYKADPDNWAAVGYTAARVALQAVKEAGSGADREKIRDALKKITNVPVVIGNGTWTQNDQRQPSYGAVIVEVKGGKFIAVK